MDWIINEFSTLSLNDKRLNKRGHKLLSQLSRNPAESIPAACCSAAETKAAYRFFDHDKVTAEAIHQPHLEATITRMAQHPVVLIPQDTTTLNFSTQYERKDTGPTISDATKGMQLHTALAVTPEKVCLGVLSVKQWHREKLQKLTKAQRTQKNYCTPIEEKESYRWLENFRLANDYAELLPETMLVSIADREGDIYDIYEAASNATINAEQNAHYLIRAQYDRKLCNKQKQGSNERIKSTLQSSEPLGKIDIHVSKTKKRKARQALMTVYCKRVTIAPPNNRKKNGHDKPVPMTAILCIEDHPPKNEKAIEWLLLTDLAVETFEQACEKIQWYTCRWQIELYFKILKSGCTIEKLQLTDENFRTCLRFYMIIAWRILFVTILGRDIPDVSCECVFSKEEWETTCVVLYRKKPPNSPPTLKEMVRMVACLGGYMNRKSDSDPGIKTLWLGMRNMQEHLRAREAFEAAYENTYG